MKERRYWLRALVVGLTTLLTGLLVYDKPPDLAGFWQPFLQGSLAALAALGVNVATRSR